MRTTPSGGTRPSATSPSTSRPRSGTSTSAGPPRIFPASHTYCIVGTVVRSPLLDTDTARRREEAWDGIPAHVSPGRVGHAGGGGCGAGGRRHDLLADDGAGRLPALQGGPGGVDR